MISLNLYGKVQEVEVTVRGSSSIMAGYNVPEKTCMLQQNHLQNLNVSEGKLTLAAAFEQCIF